MLGVAMAEEVPDEYGEIIAADMGLARHRLGDGAPAPAGYKILIIGAGASGICAAINLRAVGIDCEIIERNSDFGGTWWDNRYPGAGVDTPNVIYTYSFARNDWPQYFALQGELFQYFKSVAENHGLREIVRFDTAVQRATWNAETSKWEVRIRASDGTETTLVADAVISAVGILNAPLMPQIKGLESFPGPVVHTGAWPEGLDLTGKRVAVVGNGASAMQVVPAIADKVESLTIFARSRQWAAPFPQFRKTVPEPVRHLIKTVPLYHDWYKARLMWMFNDRLHASLQRDPEWPEPARSLNAVNDAHRRFFTDYIKQELGDRQDLLEKVLPDFPPYGKRILLDNGWYRTLTREHVTLITERLAEVRGSTLIAADGSAVEADVVILATGFKATEFLASFDVIGRDGIRLRDFWEVDNARAYLGSTVPGFPNFFTLLGPNVGLGHGGSMIKAIELQTSYIMNIMENMFLRGARTVEVREGVFEDYNRRLDEAHAKMVWTHPGTENWYRNPRGRVVAITPWRNDDFWRFTREARADEFLFDEAPAQAEAG
jgi:4-hydroxyacetophenone monooxygenase